MFEEVKAMKSSPLLGPFCGSELWGFSLKKIKRLCVFMFQTWDNSQLLRRVLWINADLTIVWSLKHKNTQPSYILNRENPQISEPQNGPRRGLDFIALIQMNALNHKKYKTDDNDKNEVARSRAEPKNKRKKIFLKLFRFRKSATFRARKWWENSRWNSFTLIGSHKFECREIN